ncbi:MAG: alpha/beta hydrolase [Bacteroidales bacterium]|jgi:acetyl esterase/lipase|nr:alpha/beta hydrolase [Bacteroidales bacterium]
MQKRLLISLVFAGLALFAVAQPKPVWLWKGVEKMQNERTRLYIYPAPDSIATGTGIIVCPGGSYHHLGLPHEGYQVAEWLNTQGITAFVLRYRVGMHGYHHPAMIEDLQRAIQYVRDNAATLHIRQDKLGVMGFSAGGHLVTMAGAFARNNFLIQHGIASQASLRPDFIVPVYPVVSMQDSLAHHHSRECLLSKHYTQADVDRFSLELNIPADMPPVFLVTAKDDPVVLYQNSVILDQALTDKNIKHKFLLYEAGRHGYGMSEKRGGETAKWRFEFIKWLQTL